MKKNSNSFKSDFESSNYLKIVIHLVFTALQKWKGQLNVV